MYKPLTPLQNATNRYLALFDTLSVDNGRKGPEWLEHIRSEAINRFADIGFPSTRSEEWRFTNIQRIAEKEFIVQEPGSSGAAPSEEGRGELEAVSGWCIVLRNGEFSPQLSHLPPSTSGIYLNGLDATLRDRPELVHRHICSVSSTSDNPFALLSTALMMDGAVLHIPSGFRSEKPIHLVHVHDSDGADTANHVRNLIVLGEGCEVTLVESHAGSAAKNYWNNQATEIVIGEGTELRHSRTQVESLQAYHTATMHVQQKANSNYEFTTIELGAELSRHDITVSLDGRGSSCSLFGLTSIRGNQHVDNHTRVIHAEPGCVSREQFNGIYDDRSRGVFTGRVIVHPGAVGTDAKQTNRNLLLSEIARVDTLPQLEIYADDVKCTHGATVGPIDEAALFYLMSRGVNEAKARDLLTYGFASEILDTIREPKVRRLIEKNMRSESGSGCSR